MSNLIGWKRASIVLLLWSSMAIMAQTQTFTSLLGFDYADGRNPGYMSLVQGADGNLYGTTELGGQFRGGTVFRIGLGGLTTLANFGNFNGGPVAPLAGLVQGTDGSFYGMSIEGGTGSCGIGGTCGTIFKMTRGGTVTVLYSFGVGGDDGVYPQAALIQATDGDFYGTTPFGGQGSCGFGCGTVFKITPSGILTTLDHFCEQLDCTDGARPYGGLVQGNDGYLYGTTSSGGSGSCTGGCGTVFKVTPGGKLTTLYNFCLQANCVDGIGPYGGALVQATDRNLYGTTGAGGAYGVGTVFKITRQGVLTTLSSFDYAHGSNPSAGLVQATDGNFYGTTQSAGTNNYGTVFTITPSGGLTTLHDFDNTDGAFPYGGLVQDTNGILYGTTYWGGELRNPSCGNGSYLGCGTIYSLDMGLGPFVAFVRDSGKVGGTAGILGEGFTGTTGVSLNGTPAGFTVVSDTFLKATVPAGATTGFVTVTTPSGTLSSNKPFRVTPQLLSFDPPSGPVGTQVTITGVSLTQTQGVGFGNRVPAQFTVNSDTQVTATVPSGAKTGKVGIETKGGTAISSGVFTITP